jgi:hypothetical protein
MRPEERMREAKWQFLRESLEYANSAEPKTQENRTNELLVSHCKT